MQSDITILATDKFDLETLLNKEKFLDSYIYEDENGFLSLESSRFEHKHIQFLLKLLFKGNDTISEIYKDNSITILDLKRNKIGISSACDIDEIYQSWLDESQRENNMDEYGMMTSFIGYINKNWEKQNLLLIADYS